MIRAVEEPAGKDTCVRKLRCIKTFLMLLVLATMPSCTSVRVRPYRDDRLLDEYRYALGEDYSDLDGLRLCYQEFGRGETVLILPGLGTSIDFWQLNIPALAQHFHVLALDLPGFGKSDKPDASYELSWICDRILAFMDARGVQRANIIGGSMGGHLGLLLALNHPDRVSALVMMGSTGDWPPPGPVLNLSLNTLWNEALVTDFLRGHWPEIFDKIIIHPSDMSRGLFRYQMALRADAARYAPEGRASARALRSIFYSSCRARLPEVRVPVLLIWGESDHIHPAKDARFMSTQIPQSSLLVVPDAGHEVMIDQPLQFNTEVISFIERHAALMPGTSGPVPR